MYRGRRQLLGKAQTGALADGAARLPNGSGGTSILPSSGRGRRCGGQAHDAKDAPPFGCAVSVGRWRAAGGRRRQNLARRPRRISVVINVAALPRRRVGAVQLRSFDVSCERVV